jgi:hypothetical protein
VSDIDIAVADSLKVLDLNGRLEKRTSLHAVGLSQGAMRRHILSPRRTTDVPYAPDCLSGS